MTNEQKIEQLIQRCETTVKRSKAILDRLIELGQDKSERYAQIAIKTATNSATLAWRIAKLMLAQTKPIEFKEGGIYSAGSAMFPNQGEPIISPNKKL